MQRLKILGIPRIRLREVFAERNFSAFRADQLYRWLFKMKYVGHIYPQHFTPWACKSCIKEEGLEKALKNKSKKEAKIIDLKKSGKMTSSEGGSEDDRR